MKNNLVGVWQLNSWILTDQDGNKNFPFGEDAKGFLIYTDSGFMSVHIMKTNRLAFQQFASIFDITPEQALDSYKSYASYCGTYKVVDNTVLHYVQMHTSPNWLNTIQERQFKVEGDVLYLSHKLEGWDSQLMWHRYVAAH